MASTLKTQELGVNVAQMGRQGLLQKMARSMSFLFSLVVITHFYVTIRNRERHFLFRDQVSTSWLAINPTVEDVVKLVNFSFLAVMAKIDRVKEKIARKKHIRPTD